MLTGIKGGGGLEKYLGVGPLKPFIDIDLIVERMTAFRLPEVEGLERHVKFRPPTLSSCLNRLETSGASAESQSTRIRTCATYATLSIRKDLQPKSMLDFDASRDNSGRRSRIFGSEGS